MNSKHYTGEVFSLNGENNFSLFFLSHISFTFKIIGPNVAYYWIFNISKTKLIDNTNSVTW